MQCKCGGEIKGRDHFIKTAKGLAEWCDIEFKKEVGLYRVDQREYTACGRSDFKVEEANQTP